MKSDRYTQWNCLASLVFFLGATTLSAQSVPANLFSDLEWRLIGPFRGGRVIAVTGVPGDGKTFYFGSVGGGIWKTIDAGTVWTPVFDSQHIASIGAIAIAPSNPDIIYAGSGEADMRSDISFGDGMYKSSDAGKTWENIGLRDSRQISRIVVHPKNPMIVYVAALGHAYGPNAERGVFRSMDGGSTWKKVLDKGEEIGAVDLAMDLERPRVLYAAMWRARRTPWSQYPPLGGPGSGLYKTTDGGNSWTELKSHGLPEGDWGRVGVAVARGTGGRRIYAIIDAEAGGLYRSDDSGGTWTYVCKDPRITTRAWYFSGLTVDPNNPDIVFVPNTALYRSADGGKTFTILRAAPGGDDYQRLWIDPTDSSRMFLGTDQGCTISLNRGQTWSTWYNQPTGQFYHVVTDNQFPYFVYGSQQDSGTVAVPSRTDHDEIRERDWYSVGGGESGYIAPDPRDPNIVYVNNSVGNLTRWDKRTAQAHNITPWPLLAFGTDISTRKYRFPWTSPLVFSPFEPGTLYYGAQFLLSTTDEGLTWKEISPDLTGDAREGKRERLPGDPTVANAKARGYGVIYTIGPSHLKAGLIWVGSDTGLIHITQDAGRRWTNVTPGSLADWSKITFIEPSHFDPAVAYAAVDRHRLDDYEPYIYRTRDYGKTWSRITTGIVPPAFLNSVREDPGKKGLLFAGTETGVYVSFDDGDHWQSIQLNLPVTSVRDLVIQNDDLVIATHGRAFWILDDITPLRQATAEVASAESWLYRPRLAIRINNTPYQGTPYPPEMPRAKNPPAGAIIDYYLKSVTSDEITLDIVDKENQLVRQYSSHAKPKLRTKFDFLISELALDVADIWLQSTAQLTAKAGMNRFVWDLRYPPPSQREGPFVLPGTYEVRLTVAGQTLKQPLTVKLDPRSTTTHDELAKQVELGLKASREIARALKGTAELRALHRQIQELKANKPVLDAPTASADAEAERILGNNLIGGLSDVLSVVNSADRKPPSQAYSLFEESTANLNVQLDRWNALRAGLVAELNQALKTSNLPEINLDVPVENRRK